MTELDVEALKQSVVQEGGSILVYASDWQAIIAALEDRDWLRAAIERAVDADDGSCPWMTELQEIALEGSDG